MPPPHDYYANGKLYILDKSKEFCLNGLHVAKGPLAGELFHITKDVVFWKGNHGPNAAVV